MTDGWTDDRQTDSRDYTVLLLRLADLTHSCLQMVKHKECRDDCSGSSYSKQIVSNMCSIETCGES